MYFDSPFEYCPVCRQQVLLDQSQGECAREYHCEGFDCPLAKYFSGKEFTQGEEPAPEDPPETRRGPPG